jgi:hypothetical protein
VMADVNVIANVSSNAEGGYGARQKAVGCGVVGCAHCVDLNGKEGEECQQISDVCVSGDRSGQMTGV